MAYKYEKPPFRRIWNSFYESFKLENVPAKGEAFSARLSSSL
jgi:hypothetical protein